MSGRSSTHREALRLGGLSVPLAVHREHSFRADAEGEAHGRARAGAGRVFRDASVHAGDLDLLRIRKAGVDPCEIGVPEDEVRAFHHERRFGRKVFWVRVRPAQPVHPVDAPGLVAADAQVQAVEFHLVQTDAPLGQRKIFQGGLPPAEPAHNGPFRGGDFRILDLDRAGQGCSPTRPRCGCDRVKSMSSATVPLFRFRGVKSDR